MAWLAHRQVVQPLPDVWICLYSGGISGSRCQGRPWLKLTLNVLQLPADDLVKAAKIVFTEVELPKKFMSDAGTNLTLDTFRYFLQEDEHKAGHGQMEPY